MPFLRLTLDQHVGRAVERLREGDAIALDAARIAGGDHDVARIVLLRHPQRADDGGQDAAPGIAQFEQLVGTNPEDAGTQVGSHLGSLTHDACA